VNEKGFSLVEVICALGLLAIVLLGIVPTVQVLMRANTISEERSNGVAAAQEVMESLRQQAPSSLPNSGSSAVQTVSVGTRDYEVVAHYCRKTAYCNDDMRHIVLEVTYAGHSVYVVETVYTRLQ
jgi:prepilin-type N-terminal cleavage/methylation domain-containing protein